MKRTINFRGHSINLNGLKAELEVIENELGRIKRLESYQRTLGGIIGRTQGETRAEYASDAWAMFGVYPLRNPETLEGEIKALADKMQPELTLAGLKTLMPEIRSIYENHIHIVDQRQTEEQANEEARIRNEQAAKHKAFVENRERLLEMGDGHIDLMSEDSVLIIQACYNASDPMSDYYHPDAHLSAEYILYRTNRKLVRREDLIRSIISQDTELSQLNWEWNKDKCRMESGIAGTSQYSETKEVNYFFQIRYAVSLARNTEALKSKWFTDNVFTPQEAVGAKTEIGASTGAYVKINEAKQGVEIYFPVKPAASVLEKIKSRGGWRWAKFNKCWYARLSESNVAFANEVAGTHVEVKTTDGAGAMVQANEDAGFDNWANQNL